MHHPQSGQTHFQSSDVDRAQDVKMLGRGLAGGKRKAESTALFLCTHQLALVEPLLGTWGCREAFESICRAASTCARLSALAWCLQQVGSKLPYESVKSFMNQLIAKLPLQSFPLSCLAPRNIWGPLISRAPGIGTGSFTRSTQACSCLPPWEEGCFPGFCAGCEHHWLPHAVKFQTPSQQPSGSRWVYGQRK